MIHNIDYLIAALIFLLIILQHFVKKWTVRFGNSRRFLVMVTVGILAIVLDISCVYLVSTPRPEHVVLSETLLTLLFVLQLQVPQMLVNYLYCILPKTGRNRKFMVTETAFFAVFALVVMLNYWHRAFFNVNGFGVYTRGKYYSVLYLVGELYLLLALLVCIFHKKELGKELVMAVTEVVVFSGTAIGIQYFNPDIQLSGFGIALGITVLFFTTNNPFNYTDGMTSALDIRFFRERSAELIEKKQTFHVLSVELSQIKRVNLIFGAYIGNKLLVETARILQSGNRKDLLFRVSGKRFMVITSSLESYKNLGSKVTEFFSSTINIDDKQVNCPAVVCGVRNAEQTENCDDLLAYIGFLVTRTASETTETTLFQGDAVSLKNYHFYQKVEQYLDVALKQDLFEVVYQPVYSLNDQGYASVEVLSRLRHPTLGMISPEIFVSIAERNGQVAQLEVLQLKKVCKFIKIHPELMTAVHNAKINLSPAELLIPGHAEELIEIIRKFDLPTSFFQFEITETVATEYKKALRRSTEKFLEAGIGLCLDDFGSGYANLNTVLKLPFKVVKLDRSLLFGILQDNRAATLYQSIVLSLSNMGFQLVAEGVEEVEELEMVTSWGVDMIQGYYFSKPLPGNKMLTEVLNPPKVKLVNKKIQIEDTVLV